MPGFALEVIEVTTLLALGGCAAAAVAIARRAYRSAAEHNASFAVEAALGAVAVLVAATLFFNHQPTRQIRHVAPPWTVRFDSPAVASSDSRRKPNSMAEACRVRSEADSDRRGGEHAERNELDESMPADRRN